MVGMGIGAYFVGTERDMDAAVHERHLDGELAVTAVGKNGDCFDWKWTNHC